MLYCLLNNGILSLFITNITRSRVFITIEMSFELAVNSLT